MEKELEELLVSRMTEEERLHYDHFFFCPFSKTNRSYRRFGKWVADFYMLQAKVGAYLAKEKFLTFCNNQLNNYHNAPKTVLYTCKSLEKNGYGYLLPTADELRGTEIKEVVKSSEANFVHVV